MKRTIAILIGITLLATLGITANAETISDPTGDVWNFDWSSGIYNFEHVSKPNVDITEVSYTVNGDQITIALKVYGTVSNSELCHYYAYVNTSDSTYWISWIEGEGLGMAMNEGAMQMDLEPEITVSGNTVTAVFNVVGTFSSGIELWGWAAEYSIEGDITSEYWQDWAPNDYDPYFGDDDDDDTTPGDDDDDDTTPGDDDDDDTTPPTPPIPPTTPGFEILTLIAAIGVALIALRKRK
ncbi:hypothetical protein B6U98_03335 [Thermoplasmatales archaeon ex4572_165]|nr:MAG: hypothetical protein B6U98_03335 [Thermoplasmatales archaeon ex4572_165]